MLPTDRPVLGKDLDAVRQKFGLMTTDFIWVLGISITRWMQIVRQAPNEPLKDPTLALLVRFLAEHPELSVVPKYPSPPEMFEMLNGISQVNAKQFSVLFGSEVSAAYRWMRQDARPSAAVNRLMYHLRSAMLMRDPAGRAEMLEQWRRTVELEAASRGSEDIFRTGKWTSSKTPSDDRE
jgi:hypothetical protein